MAGLFTSIVCGSSDAYLNPAVTVGFAMSSGQFPKVAPYIVAQMAGRFTSATLGPLIGGSLAGIFLRAIS